MDRDLTPRTCRRQRVATPGEPYFAWIPPALPPDPPLEIARLAPLLLEATGSVSRLDGAASVLPNTSLFLFMYVRKEALVSAQIPWRRQPRSSGPCGGAFSWISGTRGQVESGLKADSCTRSPGRIIARPTYPAYARQRVRGAMLDELRRLGVREQALPSREQSYDAYGTASWEGVNLKSLGERERAVICQRYHEGKSQKEVARNLRLQVKQIRELEASALQTLRTVLTNS